MHDEAFFFFFFTQNSFPLISSMTTPFRSSGAREGDLENPSLEIYSIRITLHIRKT